MEFGLNANIGYQIIIQNKKGCTIAAPFTQRILHLNLNNDDSP